jgi:DNA-binding PadR family transcriptional regulator
MAETLQNPEDSLPLTPAVFHILLSLTDEERHGYGIMQEIEQRTEGKIRVGPGTLYTALKRLIDAQMIEKADERPVQDDERRQYYRLTDWGLKVAQAEALRLQSLVQLPQTQRLLRGMKTLPGDAR